MNILVVDDSPMIVDIVSSIVTDMGHTVVGCDSGRAAIESLDESRFDLVISDVHMPEMDGFELTRRVRADARHIAVPILLLSADQSASFIDKCRAEGVTAWLKKPFQPAELERHLRRFDME
jgi:CheY-like chemotaxis protein